MHVLYNNKQVMFLDQYKKYTSNKTQVRSEKNNKTSSHYRIIRELFINNRWKWKFLSRIVSKLKRWKMVHNIKTGHSMVMIIKTTRKKNTLRAKIQTRVLAHGFIKYLLETVCEGLNLVLIFFFTLVGLPLK